MMTQVTKPVKTWGGFNVTILKVNLNPLWKNWSLHNNDLNQWHPIATSSSRILETLSMCKGKHLLIS